MGEAEYYGEDDESISSLSLSSSEEQSFESVSDDESYGEEWFRRSEEAYRESEELVQRLQNPPEPQYTLPGEQLLEPVEPQYIHPDYQLPEPVEPQYPHPDELRPQEPKYIHPDEEVCHSQLVNPKAIRGKSFSCEF